MAGPERDEEGPFSSLGNYTPTKIKIECTLYHGCEKLVDTQVLEDNTWFSNNILINKWTDFGKLRYCQLPVKTKLSINIILASFCNMFVIMLPSFCNEFAFIFWGIFHSCIFHVGPPLPGRYF